MRAIIIFLILITPLQALTYPTIGARVRTLSGYPDQKVVDFTIRNNLDERVDGYFYTIHLFDRNNQRILSAGQTNQGYRDTDLPPGHATRERIFVTCRATPVRVEVEVMLIIPTETGDVIIQ